MLPLDEDESPLKAGLVTFGSFVLFGCVPLVPTASLCALLLCLIVTALMG
jgi:hypothetical protein